jgi:transcriptional regulator with XRE-family HTH domain
MDAENRIGEFLRARREQVHPEEVGVTHLGRRRVLGLRREELATLAGVSFDYYVRLEQGRERRPSEQVLEALARALMLDVDATAHLHELARPAPRRRKRRAPAKRVRPGLLRLLTTWSQTPAFITGPRTDVLAANAIATALNPTWEAGSNIVRWLFLDEPDARALYPDFEIVAAECAASLRATVGPNLDDPELIELIGELSLKSELFRRLWARHDILETSQGIKRLTHPLVGPLELPYESFTVNGAEEQLLIICHADPGSPTERSLALLSSLSTQKPANSHLDDQPASSPADPTPNANA